MRVEDLIPRLRTEDYNLRVKNENYSSTASKVNVVRNQNKNQKKKLAVKGKSITKKFHGIYFVCFKIGHQTKDCIKKASFGKLKRGNIP